MSVAPPKWQHGELAAAVGAEDEAGRKGETFNLALDAIVALYDV